MNSQNQIQRRFSFEFFPPKTPAGMEKLQTVRDEIPYIAGMMLLPISAAVVFIRIIESMKIVDTVFILTGGGPGISTETMTLFAYQEGLKKFNLGYTSALSLLFLVIVIVFGVVYLAMLRPHMEKRA